MKKAVVLIALAVFSIGASFAQKFAYVDTDFILDNIPEYKEAQKQLDDFSIEWQKQIEAKYAEIDKLYKAYQAEQVLLTDDMKRKREDEIVAKEKEAKDFQKSKFGVEGELFKKRQELVKPIQDKVYNAIKEYADLGTYAIIFDKAGDSNNMIYSSDKYDKSNDIIKKLGYKVESK